MNVRARRRRFLHRLYAEAFVAWPILSGLIALMAVLGLIIGMLEEWSVQESLYFAFVTGLTIGFGDYTPKTLVARTLAIVIGLAGILLTALIAAIAVRALGGAEQD